MMAHKNIAAAILVKRNADQRIKRMRLAQIINSSANLFANLFTQVNLISFDTTKNKKPT